MNETNKTQGSIIFFDGLRESVPPKHVIEEMQRFDQAFPWGELNANSPISRQRGYPNYWGGRHVNLGYRRP